MGRLPRKAGRGRAPACARRLMSSEGERGKRGVVKVMVCQLVWADN